MRVLLRDKNYHTASHNAWTRKVATALGPEERKGVAAYLSSVSAAGEWVY
jgi:hypothetical protein